jgi:geranylgeranyl diphosphate synthase type II
LVEIPYPEDKRRLVEGALRRFFPDKKRYPEVIYKAMEHSLFSEAKRFRPILTLTAAEVFGLSAEKVLPTACAIEFVHTYSLIHDDLPAIDNDSLRRGRPTCHVLFGEDIAILAGDALFAEAFYLIAQKQEGKSSDVLRVLAEIAEASGVRGMVGGQVGDILSTGKTVDKDTLQFVHKYKTGKLIGASIRSGATLAGASSAELETATKYAEHLGLAFQITDDILDEVGSAEEMGKEPGSDRHKDKATYPKLFGLSESKKAAAAHIEEAKRTLEGIPRDTEGLRNLADFVGQRQR